MTTASPAPTIQRTRFTWMAYLLLGYYAFVQSILGPVVPFLQSDLQLNYTQAGFHLSLFAIGLIIASATSGRMTARFGRRIPFWVGVCAMAIGSLLMGFAQSLWVTLPAVLLMGAVGSYLLTAIQSALADQFGRWRAVALTEANIVASIFTTFAPLVISLGSQLGTWRIAFYVCAVGGLVALLLGYRISIPEQQTPYRSTKLMPPFPRLFQLLRLMIFVGVSVEWSVIFWSPSFLVKEAGFTPENASAVMSIFFGSMIVGRIVGSRLTRRYAARQLLIGAVVILLTGFPLLWLVNHDIIRIIGLAISGLGIANLYPMGLSAATDAMPYDPDRASARAIQAAGLAILIVPQVLGALADQIGIFSAFGISLILILLQFVLASIALRMRSEAQAG